MPTGLKRFQQSHNSHFLTFTCYRRRPNFSSPDAYNLFVDALERMRRRFSMLVYGYVVMPEHVHLFVSEPDLGLLSDALHFLKLSSAKRLIHAGSFPAGAFWQKRYYDRNIRDHREFTEKLRYIHLNPVTRGLVREPAGWKWSSFRHYALREVGPVEIESQWTAQDRGQRTNSVPERVFLIPG
jgi:putative transposase